MASDKCVQFLLTRTGTVVEHFHVDHQINGGNRIFASKAEVHLKPAHVTLLAEVRTGRGKSHQWMGGRSICSYPQECFSLLQYIVVN